MRLLNRRVLSLAFLPIMLLACSRSPQGAGAPSGARPTGVATKTSGAPAVVSSVPTEQPAYPAPAEGALAYPGPDSPGSAYPGPGGSGGAYPAPAGSVAATAYPGPASRRPSSSTQATASGAAPTTALAPTFRPTTPAVTGGLGQPAATIHASPTVPRSLTATASPGPSTVATPSPTTSRTPTATPNLPTLTPVPTDTPTPTATPTPPLIPGSTQIVPSDPTEFEQASGEVQLVWFYADWCGQCRALASSVNGMRLLYEDRMNFVYLDVSDARSLPIRQALYYRHPPQFVLLAPDGGLIREWRDGFPEDEVRAYIESALRQAGK